MNKKEKPARYLKPTKSTRVPQSLVFVDTEAYQLKGKKNDEIILTLRLGVAVHVRHEKGEWKRRKLLRFTTADEFWKWFEERQSPRVPVWLFAHNIGFDLTMLGLWDRIDDKRYHLGTPRPSRGRRRKDGGPAGREWSGCMILSDPPTVIALKSQFGVMRMVDTFNYFRESLQKLGDSIGLAQLDKPAAKAGDDEWYARCERDVEIIERTICGLMSHWDDLDCGIWQETAAGLAWAAFKHQLPEKSIVIDHNEPHTSTAREAYYGGHSHCFYLGEVKAKPTGRTAKQRAAGEVPLPFGPLYLLDVRSCYPYQMRHSYFPIEYHTTRYDPTVASVIDSCRRWLPIARVLVDSATDLYPFRHRPQDPPVYARGRFWTSLAGPELLYALQMGHVHYVSVVHWYIPGQPFQSFVDRWYGERVKAEQQGDKAGERLFKLILDSLSGKFGQHSIRWKDRIGHPACQRWGEWHESDFQTKERGRFRAIAGHVQSFEQEGEGREAFAAIAAFITSYARRHMAALRFFCPAGSVLYQDTDALLVTQAGYDALDQRGEIKAGELGKLQVKGKYAAAEIRGIKFYKLDKKWTVAGIKESAEETEAYVWEQERWQGLGSILQTDPGRQVRVEKIEIDLSHAGLGRAGITSGWQPVPTVIHPIVLPVLDPFRRIPQ